MRELNPFWKRTICILSIALVLFQIYTTAFGAFSALIQRGVHLGFVLSICFIIRPATKKTDRTAPVPIYDIIFSFIAIASAAFISINSTEIAWTPLKWYGWLDIFFAVATVILILEAARRSIGWTFPIMSIILVLYSCFGERFPGIWGHKNFSLNLIFQTYYHTSNGIWGTMVGISATTLAMFGIFGAILGGFEGKTGLLAKCPLFFLNSIKN